MVVRIPFEAGKNGGNGMSIWLDKKRGVLRIMVRRFECDVLVSDQNRSTAMRNLEREDGQIFLQGVETGRRLWRRRRSDRRTSPRAQAEGAGAGAGRTAGAVGTGGDRGAVDQLQEGVQCLLGSEEIHGEILAGRAPPNPDMR